MRNLIFLIINSLTLALPLALALASSAFADELSLQPLIEEALQNNHDILMSESKWKTSTYKIPQAKSLPDPMFMLGYQNEGWRRYTYGEMEGAQWMFQASQMFPFPGKLSIKEAMAERDSESLREFHEAVKLRIISRVKELYYDLFLAYREVDLIRERSALFGRIEEAALARYSSGMGSQQEVLMAQTEKYMLLEKEEMLKQKIQSTEAMLNSTLGRDVSFPLGRPREEASTLFDYDMGELINLTYEHSPELKSRQRMLSAAEAKIRMAEKEYYPDFTVSASVFKRSGEFEDMWSLSTAINIPIFYKTKQRQAVNEARSFRTEAGHEVDAVKSMILSALKENHTMLKTSERLMELYKKGLIPKAYQDFDLALTGYRTGKAEGVTVIGRLKALIDFELLYIKQFAEREKAIARIEAITGMPQRR
ncbi:MAG: TolC family protein [Nitrospirae bacterium]|nr:TolC family protein [Nitrospirota bacterium]